ncbi:MAG: ATP-binding protein [Thermodesulfobacteriota bacterium]|nr:ATP-binding protein [Thermodesulfobacteriota bacterium]
MANPFRFGQVVSGDLFCNRKSEIEQITRDLAGGQSIVLYSPRRYGKTSLLQAVSKELRTSKILYGNADFFACNSSEKVVNAVSRATAKAIIDDLKSIEKFVKRAAQIFTRTRFSIRYEPDGTGSFGISPEFSSQATSIDSLSDVFSGLSLYLKKTKKRAVIVLDEFQQIIRVNSNLEAEFRTIIQQQDRVAFAFLGSRTQLLKDMFSNEKRPFYHAAKIMELGPIKPEALSEFIKSRFKKIAVSISDELALKIATRVKGHPDYAQRLCSHILDGLEAKTVSEGFIEHGVSRMLSSLTPSFAGIFEELPLRESQVMTILSEHGPLRTFSNKMLQPYDMGTPSLHKALSNLIKKDLIRKGKGREYYVADNFLHEWIRMVSK